MNDFPKCKDGICLDTKEPPIEVRNLSVRYGAKQVLSDVSFSVAPCNITALIGPSGCGKTTFLSCINRMTDLMPSCRVTGSVRVGPIDVFSGKTDVLGLRRQVGMVFQKPNPFPLSIWKNLTLPLRQHGITEKKDVAEIAETALRDVGLWDEVKDRLHSPALALSGGQQQRLCVARTLALKPNVVLFDEPCSALDPMSSHVVEELIAGLRKRLTVVIVTHNLSQARRIADNVAVFWVMDGVGKLIEHGRSDKLFAAPEHPQTIAYLSGQVG
jgi:phosphate transport system ATP-binding protein